MSDWLTHLPVPNDAAGWNKRLDDAFVSILGATPKPVVPVSDAELDAAFFDTEVQS